MCCTVHDETVWQGVVPQHDTGRPQYTADTDEEKKTLSAKGSFDFTEHKFIHTDTNIHIHP